MHVLEAFVFLSAIMASSIAAAPAPGVGDLLLDAQKSSAAPNIGGLLSAAHSYAPGGVVTSTEILTTTPPPVLFSVPPVTTLLVVPNPTPTAPIPTPTPSIYSFPGKKSWAWCQANHGSDPSCPATNKMGII